MNTSSDFEQDSTELFRRLEHLEELSVFQDQTIEKLNDALVAQQRQLDEQALHLQTIEEKFRALWQQMNNDGGEATIPPHYSSMV